MSVRHLLGVSSSSSVKSPIAGDCLIPGVAAALGCADNTPGPVVLHGKMEGLELAHAVIPYASGGGRGCLCLLILLLLLKNPSLIHKAMSVDRQIP